MPKIKREESGDELKQGKGKATGKLKIVARPAPRGQLIVGHLKVKRPMVYTPIGPVRCQFEALK